MAKTIYVPKNFQPDSMEIIERAEQICNDYAAQGYDLTLRQLYYQFVARGWLANRDQNYKRLGSIINDARLAGLIDWDHLTDRTRNLQSLATWSSPSSIVDACARQYREDKWRDQPQYVEVWVEKEALAGVVARPADRWQVPYFSCRGYVSQSEMHAAAMRLRYHENVLGQRVTVIHLGDHDPSGVDMTRDIQDRLNLFGCRARVVRIALTMQQIDQYQPPPNPAKFTDSRASAYVDEFGTESWELDALDPATLDDLIETEITAHLDRELWDRTVDAEATGRDTLAAISDRWYDVAAFLEDAE